MPPSTNQSHVEEGPHPLPAEQEPADDVMSDFGSLIAGKKNPKPTAKGKKPVYDPAEVVGKTEDEAKAYLEGQGFSMRATMIDGEAMMVTCDHCLDRVNVSLDGGIVSAVLGVG